MTRFALIALMLVPCCTVLVRAAPDRLVAGGVIGCEVEIARDGAGHPLQRSVPLGPRTIVVLIVDFLDATVADTFDEPDPIEFIAGRMYDEAENAANLIAETSFGLTTLEPDADGDGQYDIFPVTIDVNIVGAATCEPGDWADLADLEAQAIGVDLEAYQHKMYIFPNVTGACSGWGGRGGLNGPRTWVRQKARAIFPHELGHNFGMHHSSTDPDNDGVLDVQYGDASDIMGLSTPGMRQVNGPHKVQMSWLPAAAIHDLFGGGSATFTIEALEIDPDQAQHPQIVRISRPDVPERPYLLSYRAPIGFDANLDPQYLGRVQVHGHTGESVQTLWIGGLDDGQTFSDVQAHDLVVRQLSHAATTVTVSIERDDPDLDGDGYGETVDCDDGDPEISPGAAELCDLIDNDCSGVADDAPFPDADLDGFCDALDNCPNVYNVFQLDQDGDGVGYDCDCGWNDPTNAVTLGPVRDLIFTGSTEMQWNPPLDPGDGSLSYDVLRSTDRTSFVSADCLVQGTTDTLADDADTPLAVFYYIVAARAACGSHLGLSHPPFRRPGTGCP